MITDEQARAAMDALEPDGVKSQYRQLAAVLCKWGRQELSRREQHDDGPITAEWCRENGGEQLVGWPLHRWQVGPHFVFADPDGNVSVGGGASPFARAQLLALLAALRGEHPHVSRGQANNIGPSR